MNYRPKVLFAARSFPPSVGGMQRFAYDLSQALSKKAQRFDTVTWGGSNYWLPVVLPWLFVRALWKLWTVHDYDVIHLQDGMLAPLGWTLHILSGKPYVVVAHGLDITYPNPLYQPVLWFVRRAAAVISISAATETAVLAIGVQPERSVVITIGTSDPVKNGRATKREIAEALGRPEIAGSTLLLSVGRLVRRKGVAWFVEDVLPGIVKKHPDVMYLVVGEGDERATIEQAIKNSGMREHVLLLGEVAEALKLELYKACDIFVMPNIKVPGDMEGFGIVAQEAAVSGLPVVASNLEGIADALQDGKNGILVAPEDSAAFEKEIGGLLKSAVLRHELGTAARKYTLKNFGWAEIANRYMSVYRQIMRR